MTKSQEMTEEASLPYNGFFVVIVEDGCLLGRRRMIDTPRARLVCVRQSETML